MIKAVIIKPVFKQWLPIAAAVTLLSGLIYLVVQQNIRLSANDPQIQIAEDIASGLSKGRTLQPVPETDKIDIASSLATFVIIFNDKGEPVNSSAVLDNKTPLPPSGIFAYTKSHKEDRFTWQPKSGIRMAAVVVRYEASQPGFVLAGRSLREVEKLEDHILFQVTAGGLTTMLGSLVVVFLTNVL